MSEYDIQNNGGPPWQMAIVFGLIALGLVSVLLLVT